MRCPRISASSRTPPRLTRTKAAFEGPRDAAPEGGLARARRADEAEDRAPRPFGELAHGDELEDALLGLLHAVVILVERLAGPLDIAIVLAPRRPREVGEPFAVDSQDPASGEKAWSLPEARELAPGLGQDFLGRVLREEGALELLDLRFLAVLAELAVDLLKLLAEEILALVSVDAVLHLRADLALEVDELGFAFDRGLDGLEPLEAVLDAEEGLLALGLDGQGVGDEIAELMGPLRALGLDDGPRAGFS